MSFLSVLLAQQLPVKIPPAFGQTWIQGVHPFPSNQLALTYLDFYVGRFRAALTLHRAF